MRQEMTQSGIRTRNEKPRFGKRQSSDRDSVAGRTLVGHVMVPMHDQAYAHISRGVVNRPESHVTGHGGRCLVGYEDIDVAQPGEDCMILGKDGLPETEREPAAVAPRNASTLQEVLPHAKAWFLISMPWKPDPTLVVPTQPGDNSTSFATVETLGPCVQAALRIEQVVVHGFCVGVVIAVDPVDSDPEKDEPRQLFGQWDVQLEVPGYDDVFGSVFGHGIKQGGEASMRIAVEQDGHLVSFMEMDP